MFSTEESLRRRTGPLGTGRLKYLQALVTEYQDTNEKGIIFILCRYIIILVVLYRKQASDYRKFSKLRL